MKNVIASIAATGAMLTGSIADAAADRPTIVLVHGAFADSSSWNGVIRILEKEGYPIVAAANPLRSVKGDAAYVNDILGSIASPVVLVGHSYGGMVISEAAKGRPNVKSLVFVAAFAPEVGESGLSLSGKFPGSTLAETLGEPVPLPGGGNDLYIQQDKFPEQFAADVPKAEARLMAATQRPIAQVALNDEAGDPAWKTTPSFFVYGTRDKNITPRTHAFMADRAQSRETVVVDGASHVVMVSHPAEVAKIIRKAAAHAAAANSSME